MRISQRVQSLKPSATLAVNAKAAALRAKGVRVVSFAAGEPDFDTPDAIKKAACEALMAGATKYAPVPGDPETRRLLAEKLTRENGIPGVTGDHVVLSSGGKHSLYQLFQALIDPSPTGQEAEVILPVPAWVSYRPQIELAGGRVVELETQATSDFKIDPAALARAITPRTRALVINSPSNPCGTMHTPDELREIGRVVHKAASSVAPDLVVISDELYEKIIFGGVEHFSIGSIPELAERTVTVNGLSKAYAMTGWRIGYLAGSGEFGLEVAKGVRKLQSQSTTSIATFFLPAVRTALLECDGEVETMRRAFAERASLAHDLVSAIPGFVCPKPTGAFYLFPDISAIFGRTSESGTVINSALDFAAALLEERHIAVVPGEDFGSGGERCFRMTFACSEDAIREGVAGIAAFVGSLR